jgi:uncharacterized protein (TIGR00255 family)
MLKSMTGFGKSVIELNTRNLTVEIRTLNSKQLDINLRIPAELREKEPEIRALLSKKLLRGKVDFTIQQDNNSLESAPVINTSLAKYYYDRMSLLAKEVGQDDFSGFLPVILKFPDVLMQKQKETSHKEWLGILKGINDSVEKVDRFRVHEGVVLEKDFVYRVNKIVELLDTIEPFEKERESIVRNRLKKHIEEWTELDANRFEQEMIYYLEKFDITEEKVRLRKHCDYFLETLKTVDSQGKKLGFVTQEIGREINTIGSKANHAEIQKVVVLMKDELEKIKEQLFNIL